MDITSFMDPGVPACFDESNDTCGYNHESGGNFTVDLLSNSTTAPPLDNSNLKLHVYINVPIQILLGVVTTVANLLTLLALSKVRTKFHPHLLLVVNLTISDMLFGLRTVVFRSIRLAYEFNPAVKTWFMDGNTKYCGRGLIRVFSTSIYTCTYINLMAIAFDLYFAILKPFSYSKLMTRRRTIVLSICCWIVAFILSAANYIVSLFHFFGVAKEKSFCDVRAEHQQLDIYVYLFIIYLGLILMTYLYIRIFIEVRRCARYTPGGLPMKQTQNVKSKKRKVITSLLVLVTFLIGWLPNGIMTTLFFAIPELSAGSNIGIVGLYFAGFPMMNSICDPVIYAIRLDKVRIGFRRMCGRKVNMFDYNASEVTGQISLSARSPSFESGNDSKRNSLLVLCHRLSNSNGNANLMD